MAKKTRILLVPAFGHRGTDDPGLSNSVMALVIRSEQKRFDYISVQYQVGLAMDKLGGKPEFQTPKRILTPRGDLPTEEVFDLMLKDLKAKNLDPKKAEVYVLCHDLHWSGCKWLLQARGINPIRMNFWGVKDERGRFYLKIPHDPGSHQWWIRGPIRGWLYKIPSGIGKLFRGELSRR